MKNNRRVFTLLYIFLQLFFLKGWGRAVVLKPTKSDLRVAKEIDHFNKALVTDTVAFEMQLRKYVQALNLDFINDTQQENLIAWFEYLENTNQFVEMSTYIRQTIQRLQPIEEGQSGYTEWLGDLYYKLGSYYLEADNTDALNDLLLEYEVVLHQVQSPLVHYYYHLLKSACTMNQYTDEQGVLTQADALQVLASAKKANEYLCKIPLEMIDRYHVKPVWGFYNLGKIYNSSVLPYQSDSVLHYLNKATNWATYAILKRDTTHYYKAMVSIYTLMADTYLKQNQSKRALQHVRMAMRYVDSKFLPKLTYELAYLDCYKCMSHIYRSNKNYDKALVYMDSIHVWQQRGFKTKQSMILQAVEKQMKTHAAEKMIIQMHEKLKNSRMFTLLSLLSTCLVSVIFFFVYLVYRQRRTEKDVQLKAVQEQMKEKTEALNGMMHTLEQPPAKHQGDKLRQQIIHHTIPNTRKEQYLSSLEEVDYSAMEKMIGHAAKRVTSTDRFYMICFIIDMKVEDISIILNVEPSTVYAVRYRIKKKFPTEVHESLIGF